MSEYTIESVESQPFAENSYIIWRAGRDDAVVIDPGFDTESILERLKTPRITPGRYPQYSWPR